MKKCPPGEYYCTKDKRCKSIPKGWHVMRSGYLMRDEDHKKKMVMERMGMDILMEIVMEMVTALMVMATVETEVELVKPSVYILRQEI